MVHLLACGRCSDLAPIQKILQASPVHQRAATLSAFSRSTIGLLLPSPPPLFRLTVNRLPSARMTPIAEEFNDQPIQDEPAPSIYEYQNTPENRSWAGALPVKQGLYDPELEKDACGVGFAA